MENLPNFECKFKRDGLILWPTSEWNKFDLLATWDILPFQYKLYTAFGIETILLIYSHMTLHMWLRKGTKSAKNVQSSVTYKGS